MKRSLSLQNNINDFFICSQFCNAEQICNMKKKDRRLTGKLKTGIKRKSSRTLTGTSAEYCD